jgi:hypothetical protein
MNVGKANPFLPNEFEMRQEQDRMECIVGPWKFTMVFYPGYLQLYRGSKYTKLVWSNQLMCDMTNELVVEDTFAEFQESFCRKDQIKFNALCQNIANIIEGKRRIKALSGVSDGFSIIEY